MKKPNTKFGIIRNGLNCTQDQLATCLGISRGLLSQVETGRRQMPDKAELRLLDIYQLILAAPLPLEPPASPTAGNLDELLFEWRQNLERQRRKVQTMSSRRNAALHTQVYCTRIRQQLTIDKAFDIFLRMLEAEAGAAESSITAGKIALEQLKLTALEAGLAEMVNG